jgi:hypothetical protein
MLVSRIPGFGSSLSLTLDRTATLTGIRETLAELYSRLYNSASFLTINSKFYYLNCAVAYGNYPVKPVNL